MSCRESRLSETYEDVVEKMIVLVGEGSKYGIFFVSTATNREEQNGILMGSMKEQNLFGTRMPYGTQEKEIESGDGYYIIKNKYIGLRTARYQKTL